MPRDTQRSQLDGLNRRVTGLEKLAAQLKQTPSDRCLFAKAKDFDARIRLLHERMDRMESGYLRSHLPPMHPAYAPFKPQGPSAREQYLERECAWLRGELAKYIPS